MHCILRQIKLGLCKELFIQHHYMVKCTCIYEFFSTLKIVHLCIYPNDQIRISISNKQNHNCLNRRHGPKSNNYIFHEDGNCSCSRSSTQYEIIIYWISMRCTQKESDTISMPGTRKNSLYALPRIIYC